MFSKWKSKYIFICSYGSLFQVLKLMDPTKTLVLISFIHFITFVSVSYHHLTNNTNTVVYGCSGWTSDTWVSFSYNQGIEGLYSFLEALVEDLSHGHKGYQCFSSCICRTKISVSPCNQLRAIPSHTGRPQSLAHCPRPPSLKAICSPSYSESFPLLPLLLSVTKTD